MIEEIPAPGSALGWRFSGKISGSDYAGMHDRIAAVESDARLDILCVIEDDARWGLDAVTADMRLARFAHRIGRVAVVGRPSWTSTIAFTADLWPGWTVRHFAPRSRAAAERWLTGAPEPE